MAIMNSQSGTTSLLKPYYYIEQKAYLTDRGKERDKRERPSLGEGMREAVKEKRMKCVFAGYFKIAHKEECFTL